MTCLRSFKGALCTARKILICVNDRCSLAVRLHTLRSMHICTSVPRSHFGSRGPLSILPTHRTPNCVAGSDPRGPPRDHRSRVRTLTGGVSWRVPEQRKPLHIHGCTIVFHDTWLEIGTSGNVVPQYLRDLSHGPITLTRLRPNTRYTTAKIARYICPSQDRIPTLVAEPEFLASIVLKTLQRVTIPVDVKYRRCAGKTR